MDSFNEQPKKMNRASQETDAEAVAMPADSSQTLFPDSPVYEPDEDIEPIVIADTDDVSSSNKEDDHPTQAKRKLSDSASDSSAKIQKLDLHIETGFSQALDEEVSEINAGKLKLEELAIPSTSRVRTPVRSSPRLLKRSNSAGINKPTTPKTPKSRPASVDLSRKTPKKTPLKQKPEAEDVIVISSDSSSSRPSVEFVKQFSKLPKTIEEENCEANDSQGSQGFHLCLSPSPDEDDEKSVPVPQGNHSSDPVTVMDREEILNPGKISQTRSEGYNFSDQGNLSQPVPKEFGKTTDQESTDSACSIMESPEHKPGVASKMISKLSNGNSSTPTEVAETRVLAEDIDSTPDMVKLLNSKEKRRKIDSQPVPKEFGKTTDQESTDSACSIMESPEHKPSVASKMISKLSNGNSSTPTEVAEARVLAEDSDSTPDMVKLLNGKEKRGKIDSFRTSNTTTPSTISPLQNGHSLPINTPQIPVFDIHVNHNEDNEFLSLYIVRTDSDVGLDICKEYQRISKRFSVDPYLADVSVSTSPSSVTSTGIVELPNRVSFASTVSSSTSTSSNRTSDGNFVVPQPPRKSVANPSTSVKGIDNLMKKLQDIFHTVRDTDDSNRSLTEDKVSVGIQASLSDGTTNGSASPQEVNKLCDKVTPKSSLKKTRVRGRRQIASKTKRALLPTQPEELEYVLNSPEMVPANGENGNKSPKEEKLPNLVATPKSVSKLKQKRRPTSPRPATPVEIPKAVKTEYPGFAPDTVVLAKWADKRYYSGKVLEITEPNKYLIKFDDGRSKVLLDEFIIFGDTKRLPLQGQSVYAMVDEEQNYEPGLVMGVEENSSGTVTYNCITDGDTNVMVTACELYLTEDQARALKDSAPGPGGSAPSTPRARRHNRELDLDNIIQGPRSARSRDKSGTSSARKRINSPKSPEASTSRGKSAKTPLGRVRLASESSSISESSNSAPAARIDEVAGVEPEVQRTPRKLDGVKAGPTQLKGAAKQNIGKKNSKLNKFENDEDTVSTLGPIPSGESKIFSGLHFLLTCTDAPRRQVKEKNGKTDGKGEEKNGKTDGEGDPKNGDSDGKSDKESRHYSSEEDSEATSVLGTDTEDLVFCDRPFNKERLKEQLETGGGIVHSHFDDIPKNKYSVCKLIAPRPSRTAKYICCLAGDVRALSHAWVIASCAAGARQDEDAFVLPAGYSILKDRFISWAPPSGRRNATFFKDKVILLCGDKDTFFKFWSRVCTLAGASTRLLHEEELTGEDITGALALVTDWDCPHEIQNKANQDNVPLVAPTWIVQCLIEARVIPPTSHAKFSFMYTEPE